MVVLDTSLSMADKSGTVVKIDAARNAVLDLIYNLDPDTPYGLLAYPDKGTEVDGCSIGKVQTHLHRLDVVASIAAVRRLSPAGGTPTGPALLNASALVRDAGFTHGTLVLVSDGEANCGIDPCKAATPSAPRAWTWS